MVIIIIYSNEYNSRELYCRQNTILIWIVLLNQSDVLRILTSNFENKDSMNDQNNTSIIRMFINGCVSTILFNPVDSALYKTVCDRKSFFSPCIWKESCENINQFTMLLDTILYVCLLVRESTIIYNNFI